MATPKIVPRADGEGGLGISGKGWGESFLTGNLTILSGGATTLSKIVMGTNSSKATIGVSGGTDTFFTGTGQGDLILRADDNNDKIHLGAGTSGIAAMVVTEVANIGKVGIGTASPGVPLEVLDVTASSATQGGNLRLSADDGAVMGDNHRLGVIEFAGAEDAGSTISVGARIEAICRDAWDGSNNDADLEFYTTDGTTQSKVLTLDADKKATFQGGVVVGESITGLNYRTIYVDAGSMVPQVTNGAAAGTSESADSYDVMNDFFAFDTTTVEYVQFKIVMPAQWDGSTPIKAKFYWKPSSSTTTSHDVVWSIAGQSHADGGELSAWGTAASSAADNVIATDSTKKVHITAASGACTIAGSPAAGADELVYFRIHRAVGSDDLNEDAHLLGVSIQYRETATADGAW